MSSTRPTFLLVPLVADVSENTSPVIIAGLIKLVLVFFQGGSEQSKSFFST